MFQNYKTKTLKKDILSGIIVALVSIPISMGYAQVAGLPVVYGLDRKSTRLNSSHIL